MSTADIKKCFRVDERVLDSQGKLACEGGLKIDFPTEGRKSMLTQSTEEVKHTWHSLIVELNQQLTKNRSARSAISSFRLQ